MLSGAIGLQIIARRLGVELGEQQFNTITGVDERELTFDEIKRLATNHSLVCRALKTKLAMPSSPTLNWIFFPSYKLIFCLLIKIPSV